MRPDAMAVIARRHRLTAASEGLGDGLYCGGTSRWAPLALKGPLKDDNRASSVRDQGSNLKIRLSSAVRRPA